MPQETWIAEDLITGTFDVSFDYFAFPTKTHSILFVTGIRSRKFRCIHAGLLAMNRRRFAQMKNRSEWQQPEKQIDRFIEVQSGLGLCRSKKSPHM